MKKIKITAEFTQAEEGGYIVYCPELDITTEGETMDNFFYDDEVRIETERSATEKAARVLTRAPTLTELLGDIDELPDVLMMEALAQVH